MRQILLFFACFVLCTACQNEDDYIYQNPVSLGNIKFISLRADHKTLLPDGKAKMQFYIEAYGIKELPDYSVTMEGDSVRYYPSVACDTFKIPSDAIPAGVLKLYDETGNEYPDFGYSTTDTRERTITFYARSGELESNKLTVQIRPLPEVYEELVFPVIFHVLEEDTKFGIASVSITAESVKKNLERLNKVFNGLLTTDPNGGNAHIRFEAAVYDPSGVKLPDEGIHRYASKLPDSFWVQGEDAVKIAEDYVLKNDLYLMYDYRNYLNVWLINNPNGASSSAKVPTVILNGESIPGLEATNWPVTGFPLRPRDVGIFIDMGHFLNPMSSSDFFEISTAVAQYFGLLTTRASGFADYTNIVDGDTDYCPDTYYYWEDNQSIFKNTGKNGIPDEDSEYFTSYNVMDRYSKKTSITVDQMKRIREHIEKCPSRWMYKSKYPFTGNRGDWKAL